jgi:hypothetical protein
MGVMAGALALGGCATTGAVKRAQASADQANSAAQAAQAAATRAQSTADAAGAAAQRAQTSADTAASAAQAATSQAQATSTRVDELSTTVQKMQQQRTRATGHRRHRPRASATQGATAGERG